MLPIELVVDSRDNCNEFRIPKIQRSRSRSIIVSGPWKIDHFPPPSDRASRGPVMTEDLSLPPAIGWHEVFLTRHQLQRELADLAFKRPNVGLVLGINGRLRFLVAPLAVIELRYLQMDEVSRSLLDVVFSVLPDLSNFRIMSNMSDNTRLLMNLLLG
jgi:hypothetical protein